MVERIVVLAQSVKALAKTIKDAWNVLVQIVSLIEVFDCLFDLV
jgi:hypothetical protein